MSALLAAMRRWTMLSQCAITQRGSRVGVCFESLRERRAPRGVSPAALDYLVRDPLFENQIDNCEQVEDVDDIVGIKVGSREGLSR